MLRSMFPHACVLVSMFSTCFMLSSMCLCAPCRVYVPRPRLCLSCHVLLLPFFHFVFLSCVLAYRFGPDLDPMVFVIVHTPCPTSKGLDHSYLHVYACFLLYFMSILASLVLGFATLDALSGFGGCVVTSNAHEALFGCNHLGYIAMMLVTLCVPSLFPLHAMLCLPCLFVPSVSFPCIFTCLLICPCMSLAC